MAGITCLMESGAAIQEQATELTSALGQKLNDLLNESLDAESNLSREEHRLAEKEKALQEQLRALENDRRKLQEERARRSTDITTKRANIEAEMRVAEETAAAQHESLATETRKAHAAAVTQLNTHKNLDAAKPTLLLALISVYEQLVPNAKSKKTTREAQRAQDQGNQQDNASPTYSPTSPTYSPVSHR